MGIIKEYFCPGHGDFESDQPTCPHGCSVAERAFRTAPAVKSDFTRGFDRTVETLAKDFRVSNFNNDGGRGPARVDDARTKRMMEHNEAIRRKFPSAWGQVPRGGVYESGGNIREAGRGPGAPATLAAYNAPATNLVEDMKPVMEKPAVKYIRDPDPHSIAKVRAA